MNSWKRLAVVVATAGIAFAAGYIVRDTTDIEALPAGIVRSSLLSQVLNEEREYLVYLPEGYETDVSQRYPVLYVLDGASQAGPAAETAALMARIGVTPSLIVVGVTEDGKTRNRDYTPPGLLTDVGDPASPKGSGDRFLSFLRQELIVAIERDYRTARPRILSGWSRSGLFVVYSQTDDPALFDARIAHSPALWRENGAFLSRFQAALQTTPAVPGYLFLSLGDKENEKMTAAFKSADAIMKAHAPAAVRWQVYWSRGGVHETNPRLSLPVALDALFRAEGNVPGPRR